MIEQQSLCVRYEARCDHGARVRLESENLLSSIDQESPHGHRRRLGRKRQNEMHRTITVYLKAAILGNVERSFGGNLTRDLAGLHGCGAAENAEFVFLLEIRRRA